MLASALFAGFAAGLIAAVLQFAFVQPVLLQAELYESGELVHFGADADATAGSDQGEDDRAAAQDDGDGASGLARNGLSVVFSALIYAGYGLVLVSGFALAARHGLRITARSGLLWGVAGFVAAQLAPAAGLAPDLPGSAAADVVARQVWWFGTVAASALGLALVAFGKGWAHWGIAAVLLLAPHVIGAPLPDTLSGVAPPELAGEFAARALSVGLAAWAVLGLLAGHFWSREPLV